jgi:hypothetical protein
MKEVWKQIKGFEGWYSVSNRGRIRRDFPGHGTKIGRIRKLNTDNDGYSTIILCKDNIRTHLKVHSLVANAFIGSRPKGMEINHKDNVRNNNLFTNIEYKTHQENVLHSYRMGRSRLTGGRKLTTNKILSIKKEYGTGNFTHKILSEKYKVCPSTISRVVTNNTWKHLSK